MRALTIRQPWALGVDCGLTGAWALLDDDGRLVDVDDMPAGDTPGSISATFLGHAIGSRCPSRATPRVAVVEIAGAMPGQGVSSTWKFARATGVVEGVLAGLGWPIHTVSPARWKRALGLGKDKGASRAMAARLWPDMADRFARVRDDGRAEAALIAHWWREQQR